MKLNLDGTLTHLRARLDAKGYFQVYDINHQDTFSLVAKLTSVRILIILAVTYHWPFNQLDVKTAFLNIVLDEKIYMEQLANFVAQRESWKVNRSLYGLKQSSRAWFGRFASVIRAFGLFCS